MDKLVTIALPVYKRFEFLPNALRVVEAQTYANTELLVSDNGENGEDLRELVDRHYGRSYRFRRNPETVDITTHFNQMVNAATGEYFVLLCDDDEVSRNYVEELVGLLERHPEVDIALSRQEKIDHEGHRLLESACDLPELIPGDRFARLRAAYKETGFRNTVTHLSRTGALRECGAWPAFEGNQFSDEALVMKLSLNGHVAFSSECVFRHRAYDESFGVNLSIWDLAKANRQFLTFLDEDPAVREFARTHPGRYAMLRRHFVGMMWRQYYRVWKHRYRGRLPYFEWIRSAFTLPFIPAYYARLPWPILHYSASRLKNAIVP